MILWRLTNDRKRAEFLGSARNFFVGFKLDNIYTLLLLSDKNIIIPKSAIDEANIAPFTSKILK